MQQRRLPVEVGEIRLLAEDEVPVRDVAHRRQHVDPQLGELSWQPRQRIRERRREQHEERRKQSPCPADPEGPQVDPPMHTPLVDEQARNEVATDYEEDFDAEESARQPVESRVVQQHGEDGDCAQAIQACETTQTRGGFELGFGRFGAGFGIDALRREWKTRNDEKAKGPWREVHQDVRNSGESTPNDEPVPFLPPWTPDELSIPFAFSRLRAFHSLRRPWERTR